MNRRIQGRRRWHDLTGRQKTAVAVSAVVQFGLAAAAWTDLAWATMIAGAIGGEESSDVR